jgi:hypothetical protein
MEMDKRYSIVFADKKFHFTCFLITLFLHVDDKSVGLCFLPPLYSHSFRDEDITDISERGKYKLSYRKNNCGQDCYFFEIEK